MAEIRELIPGKEGGRTTGAAHPTYIHLTAANDNNPPPNPRARWLAALVVVGAVAYALLRFGVL